MSSAKDIIDARPETIGSLITFSSNPSVISVPSYQRSYQWDTSRVLDIMRLSDPDNRSFGFIGTMVFVRNKDQGLEVVDGQQRLITVVLVLCAFRDFLHELSAKVDDEKITKMLGDMERDIQSENLLVSKSYSSVEVKPRLEFSRTTYDTFKNAYLLGVVGYEPEDEVAKKELNTLSKNYKIAKDYLNNKYPPDYQEFSIVP